MAFITPDYVHEPLYVVTPIFNPVRWKSRWKLYERFAKHVKDSGGVLVTVEAAFGERHHALDTGVTQHGTDIHQSAPIKEAEFHHSRTTNNHIYVKVRTRSELWVKENLINIGIAHVLARYPDAKYFAWVDSDVLFVRPNWVGETVHQLQHYDFVQMFSEAEDVGPAFEGLSRDCRQNRHLGYVYCYLNGVPGPPGGHGSHCYYSKPSKRGGPNLWHPGFAWAARRSALDHVGGLLDFAILGAGDRHMATALIGRVDESILHAQGLTPAYRRRLMEWQFRCETHIRRNIGYVSGLLIHNWHGSKQNRRYINRWKILIDNKYDPDIDIKYDAQGLLQLVDRGTPRSRALRDAIRRYFRQRNEDSIDV